MAIESTGIYWHPIHAVLEGKVDLIVANAYKIKHTPGRKTDGRDIDEIVEGIPSERLRKKADQIKEAIKSRL